MNCDKCQKEYDNANALNGEKWFSVHVAVWSYGRHFYQGMNKDENKEKIIIICQECKREIID